MTLRSVEHTLSSQGACSEEGGCYQRKKGWDKGEEKKSPDGMIH